MSELLKEQVNAEKVEKLAALIVDQNQAFDQQAFLQSVLCDNWQSLSLMQRIRQISTVLHSAFLQTPGLQKYIKQVVVLENIEHQFDGLFHFVFQDFVGQYGLDDFDVSMQALKKFTQNSTAEFALREFIESDAERAKDYLLNWLKSDNPHHRRLASESIRPKLPWAKHLPWIGQNPKWAEPIIEYLLDDDSKYVQKSVANLINDLSKTQPDWVLQKADLWMSATTPSNSAKKGIADVISSDSAFSNSSRQWVIKHGLRTLFKGGNPKALALFGWHSATEIDCLEFNIDSEVLLGHALHWSFCLKSKHSHKALGKLRIEYALYFLRAKQPPYRKVFKIKEIDSKASEQVFYAKHAFKPMTTRKLYQGLHQFELLVNGQVLKQSQFFLHLD